MSDLVPRLTPRFTQNQASQASVLGPGIASIFIQGIESGLVIAQFSRWFYARERGESSLVSTIVVFVTFVGLAQSGICFASAWTRYVRQFGIPPSPDWEDYAHTIPTLFISVPVQALMIRRCYHIVRRNMFIIIPLVLLLVASIGVSLWSTAILIHIFIVVPVNDPLPYLRRAGMSLIWPFLMSGLLPSILDIIVTGILLHYLIRTMKQVYATHTRKEICRFTNIVWQSALPPTLCAICVCVFLIQFSTARQKKLQPWLTVIQAMIGKLYVLSLLYTINARPLQPDVRATGFISTLTVPTEVMFPLSRDGRSGDVACDHIFVECRSATTVGSAV